MSSARPAQWPGAMTLKIEIKPEPKRWSVRIEDRTVALCADLRQAARLAAALQARSSHPA
jgi:hypothetical protein